MRLTALVILLCGASAASADAQVPYARGQGPQRQVQIFSESFSLAARGPYFVRLDSGVAYRLVTDGAEGDVSIVPRPSHLPPLRFSITMLSGTGAPFEAPTSTEYRVESTYNGNSVLLVRIFRVLPDSTAAACAADPTGPRCSLALGGPDRGFHIPPSVVVLAGLLPLFFWGFFRNGKSF